MFSRRHGESEDVGGGGRGKAKVGFKVYVGSF